VDDPQPATVAAARTGPPRPAAVGPAGLARWPARSRRRRAGAHCGAVDCSSRWFGAATRLPGPHAAAGDPVQRRGEKDRTAYPLGRCGRESGWEGFPAATGGRGREAQAGTLRPRAAALDRDTPLRPHRLGTRRRPGWSGVPSGSETVHRRAATAARLGRSPGHGDEPVDCRRGRL